MIETLFDVFCMRERFTFLFQFLLHPFIEVGTLDIVVLETKVFFVFPVLFYRGTQVVQPFFQLFVFIIRCVIGIALLCVVADDINHI